MSGSVSNLCHRGSNLAISQWSEVQPVRPAVLHLRARYAVSMFTTASSGSDRGHSGCLRLKSFSGRRARAGVRSIHTAAPRRNRRTRCRLVSVTGQVAHWMDRNTVEQLSSVRARSATQRMPASAAIAILDSRAASGLRGTRSRWARLSECIMIRVLVAGHREGMADPGLFIACDRIESPVGLSRGCRHRCYTGAQGTR